MVGGRSRIGEKEATYDMKKVGVAILSLSIKEKKSRTGLHINY